MHPLWYNKRRDDMKILNKLICLYMGHNWILQGVSDLPTKAAKELTLKCTRCGKIKKEVI